MKITHCNYPEFQLNDDTIILMSHQHHSSGGGVETRLPGPLMAGAGVGWLASTDSTLAMAAPGTAVDW